MSINLITITAATRPASVVPTYAFAMGEVCAMTDLHVVSVKRRTASAQATAWATPGPRQPWSPPVT